MLTEISDLKPRARLRGFLDQTLRPRADSDASTAPHVTLHLRFGGPEPEGQLLESCLAMLGNAPSRPLWVGYFAGGEAAWVPDLLTEPSQHVTLREGSDWDWEIWFVTLSRVQACYRASHAWPNLLFPQRGGWLLETPPSTNETYLYPAPQLADEA